MKKYEIAVSFSNGIDENGMEIFKTKIINLKTYILLKLKTSERNFVFSNEFFSQILKKIRQYSKEFEEKIEEYVESKTDEELIEIFDLLGVKKSNYIRFGMNKDDFSKLSRSGKLRKLKVNLSNYDKRIFYKFSLKRYLKYTQNQNYFDTLKTKRDWFLEGRAINDDILSKLPSIEPINYYNQIENFNFEETRAELEKTLNECKFFFQDKIFFDFDETHKITVEEKKEFEKKEALEKNVKKELKRYKSKRKRILKKLSNEKLTIFDWTKNKRYIDEFYSSFLKRNLTYETLLKFYDFNETEEGSRYTLSYLENNFVRLRLYLAISLNIEDEETIKNYDIMELIKEGQKNNISLKDFFTKYEDVIQKLIKKLYPKTLDFFNAEDNVPF